MSGPENVYSAAAGGSWSTAATWKLDAAGTTPAGFVPNGTVNTFITGNAVTAAATARAKNLTINPVGQLTVNTGITLTATGNFAILSDASGTGSFLNNGTLAVTGTTSAQRWVTANWTGGFPNTSTIWHYVSSPVSSATINTFLNSLLNKWNEVGNTWDPLTLPVTQPLVPGVGYGLAKAWPDGIVTFTGGALNNASFYAPALTLTGAAGPGTGWNLLGNPYPCPISWDAITRTNVSGAVYTWNGSSHNYVTYSGGTGSLSGGIIPAEQAFFVQAQTGTATCTIPAAARQHSGTNAIYKNTSVNLLTMKVKGNDATEDIAFIQFKPEATLGFDTEYDAYKLFGMEDAPQLYSITSADILSINSLPEISAQPVIQMGLKVGFNGLYTFTASDIESFPSGTEIFLEDLQAGNTQNLTTNPVYSFNAAPGDPVHRFNLHFSPVGVPETKTSGIKIYSAEQTVYVNIPVNMHGTIIVYNLLGSEITRKPILGNSLNKFNLNVPSGYYLIKVDGDSNTAAEKVFIR